MLSDLLQTRQQVYEWRLSFQPIAIKLVQEEIAQRNFKSRSAVRTWTQNSILRGGEALYSEPDHIVSVHFMCQTQSHSV